MIAELSAGCECWLFGTGLVMSENASDCTQNAAYRDRKLKKILERGHSPLTIREEDAPSPNPTPLGASILAPLALDLLPLHFHHLPPPHLTLLATGLYFINILASLPVKIFEKSGIILRSCGGKVTRLAFWLSLTEHKGNAE